MKKVLILKRCQFKPLGSTDRIPARPGQVVIVSEKDAEIMVSGNVAIEQPAPKAKPKKAPVNRKKKVEAVK